MVDDILELLYKKLIVEPSPNLLAMICAFQSIRGLEGISITNEIWYNNYIAALDYYRYIDKRIQNIIMLKKIKIEIFRLIILYNIYERR